MTAQHLYYLFQCFFIYAFLGWCTEVAFAAFKERRFVNRGFLNGPICPVYGFGVVAVIHFLTPLRSNLLLLYLGSAILVTAIEWLTGFILEKVFHNKWWDYSNMPLNLNGYVCLLFSLIWGVFCVFIVDVFHPLIDTLLSHIPFLVGIILVCILVIAGLADLYVTASGILKLNKRLEKMQAIADNFIRFPTSLVNQSTSVPLQLWKNRKSSKILYLRSRKNLNLLFPKNRKQFQTPLPMFLTK